MNNAEEIWKPIKNLELQYQVSNYGRIKHLSYTYIDTFNRKYTFKERIINGCLHPTGYVYVTLKGRTYRLHRIVAETFIDNPLNKPYVDHIDGDKTNNIVSNLRWVTSKENTNNPNTLSRCIESWTKSNKSRIKPVYQLDDNYEVIAKFNSAEDAAKSIGCSSVFIHRCCTISRRKAKGFHWSYSPIKLKTNLKK